MSSREKWSGWQEAMGLRPWHLGVEIAPGLGTRDFYEASKQEGESFYDPRPGLEELLLQVFPSGLDGRSVLDCACNNGAFLFAAKELGAGRCVGVDVRELWIEQARFLLRHLRHREGPTDDMRFEVGDLYELANLDERFDVTIFSGLLYHLPEPIRGLEIAARLTSELLYVGTATISGYPDGLLVAGQEPTEAPLSGVYGLQWFPTGPRVVSKMLAWTGFSETRCVAWRTPSDSADELDAVQVIAAREPSTLAHYDETRPRGPRRIRQVVLTEVPPRATVLVASQGEEDALRFRHRTALHFPQNDAGRYEPCDDAKTLIKRLEQLREGGAGYLFVPARSLSWLHEHAPFRRHLEDRYRPLADGGDDGVVYELSSKTA
jgi:tRNA (mo5U34)-methyltransferase